MRSYLGKIGAGVLMVGARRRQGEARQLLQGAAVARKSNTQAWNKQRRNTLIAGLLLILAVGGFSWRGMLQVQRQRLLDQLLIHAVLGEDTQAIPSLLDLGADPNARDVPIPKNVRLTDLWHLLWHDPAQERVYPTALAYAVDHAKPNIIQLLLERGADPNARDAAGATNFMYALMQQRDCKPFLDHGAEVNAKNLLGQTPLMGAVCKRTFSQKDIATIRLLIARRADVNARDNDGRTPLMCAAVFSSGGQLCGVDLLLQAHTDINAQDKAGGTALLYALEANSDEALKLIAQGADVNVRLATLPPKWTITTQRVERDIPSPLPGKPQLPAGSTALMQAAYNGAFDLAHPQMDLQQEQIVSPKVALNRDLDMVRLLLAKGADVNIRNSQGRTALSYAPHAIAALLQKAGAKE